jgi:hypothetical protein
MRLQSFAICYEVLASREAPEKCQAMMEWYEKKAQELEFFIHRMRKKDPLVRAQDLQERGIRPGIQMGNLLQLAEKIAVNQNLRDKEAILKELPL